MPNHWIDELVCSKNTVDRTTRITLSAFCSSSCFDATTETESGSTFGDPVAQSHCSFTATARSFYSDSSPGTRLRSSSDKEASRPSARHCAFNSDRATTPLPRC